MPFRSVIVALVFTFAATASAQTTSSSSSGQPPLVLKEQVEVVATRVPEVPHDVPAPIEVIDGETLRAMGASTLRDALALAAGVEIGPGGDGGPAAAVPEFWGLREFDAFLLVVDEIPWGGAFNPDLATLNLRDVERVEILRGPAPVTYGATSFAGVIHVVHTSPAAASAYLSVQGGAFGSGTVALDVAIPAAGSWTSRLSADFERRGFSDDRSAFTRRHVTYRAATTAADSRTWLSADLNWLGQTPASPHVREGAALSAATPLDANYNPAGAFLDNTRVSFMAGTERRVSGRARWTATGSYSYASQNIFRGFLTTIANAPDNATGFREDIGIHDAYADSHIAWRPRPALQTVAGGDFLFGHGEGRGAAFTYSVPLSGAPTVAVREPDVLDLETASRRAFTGAYAQAEWNAAPRVRLSAGLRLNVTTEGREHIRLTRVRPAGSVGAITTLWERGANHVRLFADYRDTFKPAAFDFSLAENEGILEPETARTVEGGVKLRAAGGRFDLEASGFRMDFRNLVTSTVVGGLPSLQNAGTTRFQGFEIAAAARGPRSLSARATYSFHDGRFVDFVQQFGGTNTQLAGKRFEMSARHLFSAGVILAPPAGVVGDIILKHAGDRYLNKRNTALASPFTTIDAGLGYRFNRWEVRVDGRNLSDRRDPISESEIGDAQYYRLPARRFDASAAVRF